MSRKYYDRLLVGSGSTNKEVKSEYGSKLMEKMGWKKGDGLGRTMDGIVECIQIKRRDENLGMGAEMETPGSKFKWNDMFWDDAYNTMAAKFSANAPKGTGPANDDSFDKKIDIDSSEDDSDASSCSSFDGDIVIEKSSKPLFTVPKIKEKDSKGEKLDKSKVIKKEKKDKKKKKSKK